jgi:hypothetical protein
MNLHRYVMKSVVCGERVEGIAMKSVRWVHGRVPNSKFQMPSAECQIGVRTGDEAVLYIVK